MQTAKREKKDLPVGWVGQCIWVSTAAAHCLYAPFLLHPRQHQGHDYELFFGSFSLQKFTTGWQQLEVVIAMGRAISHPAAFEVTLFGAGQVVLVWWPVGGVGFSPRGATVYR